MEPHPNPKVAYVVATLLVLILAGGAFALGRSGIGAKPTETNTPSPSPTESVAQASPSPSAGSSPAVASSSTYKTAAFSVDVPAGWTAAAVTGNAAAVNITKGSYILYVNANAKQASGVEGGRFAEIAQGAPSADLVIRSWPSDPCIKPEFTAAKATFFTRRADLYVSDAGQGGCVTPTDGSTHWYFSYLTGASNSYFNYYSEAETSGLVVTMGYKAATVNELPRKGDQALTETLTEMTEIAKSVSVTGR